MKMARVSVRITFSISRHRECNLSSGTGPVMLDEFVSWYREKNPDLPEPASQD